MVADILSMPMGGNHDLRDWFTEVRSYTNNRPFKYKDLPDRLRNISYFRICISNGNIVKRGKKDKDYKNIWVLR